LKKVIRSHYYKPSRIKQKTQKQKDERVIMRQVAAIFGGKGGTVKTNAQNSPEMDAIILTRWAKRRLPALRAARELRLD
jgi:hypothetical protein